MNRDVYRLLVQYMLRDNTSYYNRAEAYTLLTIHAFYKDSVLAWLPKDVLIFMIKNYIL